MEPTSRFFTRHRLLRLCVAIAFAMGIAAFLLWGPTEQEMLAHQRDWKALSQDNLLVALIVFFFAEVILVGISAPVGTALSLIAGFLFGRWWGVLVVSFASTLGALISMLSARYVLSESIRKRIQSRWRWKLTLDALDRGIDRDGWFYLLIIRMTPVLPFFAVNVLSGLTKVRISTYWWTSQLGMLPTSFIVVSAAAEVGEIQSFRELATFERFWPLLLLLLVPIAMKLLTKRYLRRTVRQMPVA